MKGSLSLIVFVAMTPFAAAQNLSAQCEFAEKEAKPGQVVTLRIQLKLDEGWHTYPTVQPDASAGSSVNKFKFPEKGPIIFVDKVKEPEHPKFKDDASASIKNMHVYDGGGVWERKAVISPNAKPGELELDLPLRLIYCSDAKGTCIPHNLSVKSKIKVVGEPIAVESKYNEAVQKAIKDGESRK